MKLSKKEKKAGENAWVIYFAVVKMPIQMPVYHIRLPAVASDSTFLLIQPEGGMPPGCSEELGLWKF